MYYKTSLAGKTKMTEKLRILQVLPSMEAGGTEKMVLDTAAAIAGAGHLSFVASSGGGMTKDLRRAGVKHFKIPLNLKNPLMLLYNAIALAYIVKKHNINIIQAESRGPAWSACIAAKLTGCKFITTFNGCYGIKPSIKKLYNQIMTKGDVVVAVSNFIKHHIVDNYKCKKDSIVVVHRGVDVELFNPARPVPTKLLDFQKYIPDVEKNFVITLPARLSSVKGHQVLLEALAKLTSKQWSCLILGATSANPKYYRKLLELTERLGISDNISFIGNIEDMRSIYKISDLVVVPSIKPESFGIAVAEAQAMKKIVIATDIGAFKELIVDGVSGFLVPIGDVDALSAKIDNVMKMSATKVARMASAGRDSVCKNFSLHKMQTKMLSLYESL